MPASAASLKSCSIVTAGNWRESTAADVLAVLTRMRDAALENVSCRSDRQPTVLRVEDKLSGSPAVWLHTEEPTTAVIIVDVGTRDWCNLAYQFGHELGHVFANSWTWDAKPRNPSQWLEEAVVESFSIRSLGKLADSWRISPPFPQDNAYANAIRDYRERLLQSDRQEADERHGAAGLTAWYTGRADYLSSHGGVDDAKPAVPAVVKLLEEDDAAVADIGAMNRWLERTGVPLGDYLQRWQASCVELGLSGTLPRRLRESLLPRG